jgi:HNH endonuclease
VNLEQSRQTARTRLFSHLVIDPSGCLLWTRPPNSRGYGVIRIGGKHRLVHRVMWELFNGPIPDGLRPDHLCRVRHCANVAHLELVTHRENTLRGTGPTAINAAADRCWRGHFFNEANTYYRATGGRECRACRVIRKRAYRERRRQAFTAIAAERTP